MTVTGTVDTTRPGTYTVTYTATNGFFTTSVDRTVVVADGTAPSIQGFSLTPSSIWPPNHKMIDVTLTYIVSDASHTAECTPSVTSSEAPNATGSGHTAADTRVIDATRVQVRSERSGETRDRVYTVTLTCGDAAGNTATETRQVRVFKNR